MGTYILSQARYKYGIEAYDCRSSEMGCFVSGAHNALRGFSVLEWKVDYLLPAIAPDQAESCHTAHTSLNWPVPSPYACSSRTMSRRR